MGRISCCRLCSLCSSSHLLSLPNATLSLGGVCDCVLDRTLMVVLASASTGMHLMSLWNISKSKICLMKTFYKTFVCVTQRTMLCGQRYDTSVFFSSGGNYPDSLSVGFVCTSKYTTTIDRIPLTPAGPAVNTRLEGEGGFGFMQPCFLIV